mgnify:CR=1 FL=1
MPKNKYKICIGCVENDLFCDACDETDKYYIKKYLANLLKRDINITELCKLCKAHKAYREVICYRCR